MRGIINLSLGMLIFWAVGAALLFQHGAEAFRFNPRLLAGGLFGFADRPIRLADIFWSSRSRSAWHRRTACSAAWPSESASRWSWPSH